MTRDWWRARCGRSSSSGPEVSKRKPQNMCMDKGYDYPDTRQLVSDWGYTARIKARGEEVEEKKKCLAIDPGGGWWSGPIHG